MLENNNYTLATTKRKKKKKITEHGNQNGIAQLKRTRRIKSILVMEQERKEILLADGLFLVHRSMNGEVDFKR